MSPQPTRKGTTVPSTAVADPAFILMVAHPKLSGPGRTRLLTDGLRDLLRHADIQTTMNIYTQAITSAKQEAASKLVDVLWRT